MIYVPNRTVLCHGCFDVLHLGHIRHLQEAADMGSTLVVSVTADEFVNKGMGRPHFTAEQRAEALRALSCVASVQINHSHNAVNMIHRIRPEIYCKGTDYSGEVSPDLQLEIDAVKAIGGEFRVTHSKKWSSSRLINMDKFDDATIQYLDGLKAAGTRDKILKAFEIADSKTILFVGETIRDIYNYVRGLGRASKELMLATVQTGSESFDGGVIAASKHGEWKHRNIVTGGMITKTRFVDVDFNKKVLDVYDTPRLQLEPDFIETFRATLADAVSSHDTIIAFDFGHGLLGPIERFALTEHSPWLAVNSQTNAGNYGYNLVTNYIGAKYVCVDEPEARLASRVQFDPLRKAINVLQAKQRSFRYLVTRGRFGSAWYSSGTYGEAPALVHGGVDTMGAGDAVMAVTAPLVSAGLDVELAAFVGNVVGAIKIGTVGHRSHVKRNDIIQTVEALLA